MQNALLKRELACVIIILLFVGTSIIPLLEGTAVKDNDLKVERTYIMEIIPERSERSILYVGGSGPGNYTKIQDAIDDAFDGYIIRVFPGIYEENIIVNKSLKIIGNSSKNTAIKGIGSYNIVVMIFADNVLLKGFNITNGNRAGVRMDSTNNCIIGENNFIDNEIGSLVVYSQNATISNNNYTRCGLGFLGNNLQNFLHIVENNTINDLELFYKKNGNNIFINGEFNNYGCIILVNCTNVEIENLTNLSDAFMGVELAYCSNVKVESSHIRDNYFGIYVHNCSSNVSLQNNTILASETGVYIGRSSISMDNNDVSGNLRGIELYKSSENFINSNIIHNNSNTGIYLLNSYDNIIGENNEIKDNVNGIDIYYSYDNIIKNNAIENNSYIGIFMKNASLNNIRYNNIERNELAGIEIIQQSCYNEIVENDIKSNPHYGIYFDHSNNNIIRHNSIMNNYGGIRLSRSANNSIIDNFCNSNLIDGIGFFWSSMNNIVKNNTISNNMKGIAIRDSSYNQITENIYYKNLHGILLNNAKRNNVTGNICSENKIGLYIYQSNHNSLFYNHFNSSSYEGLAIIKSAYNTLEGNTIEYNYQGLVLQDSLLNKILHNEIYNNTTFGIILQRTIGNKINFNNIYSNADCGLVGINCFDNARFNYWGYKRPKKLVVGRVKIFPWLLFPVNMSNNFDDGFSGKSIISCNYREVAKVLPPLPLFELETSRDESMDIYYYPKNDLTIHEVDSRYIGHPSDTAFFQLLGRFKNCFTLLNKFIEEKPVLCKMLNLT